MVDNGNGYTFHPDSRTFQYGSERIKRQQGVQEPVGPVSRFNRADRIIVAKYGCSRCPHRGTKLCPYGIGNTRLESRSYMVQPGERLVTENDKGKLVMNERHENGICAERVHEMQMWGAKISNMNGLLAERAETLFELKDLKTKLVSLTAELPKEDMTFRTPDGDLKVKSALIQAQDIISKYNDLIETAISQTMKYDELKLREREGPKVIDIDAIEKHFKKLKSVNAIELPDKVSVDTSTKTPVESSDSIPAEVDKSEVTDAKRA